LSDRVESTAADRPRQLTIIQRSAERHRRILNDHELMQALAAALEGENIKVRALIYQVE
jgi:hypothetical protein